jgi:hypothetical protein
MGAVTRIGPEAAGDGDGAEGEDENRAGARDGGAGAWAEQSGRDAECQHGRDRPQTEGEHGESAARDRGRARGLSGEGVDELAGKKGIEDAEGQGRERSPRAHHAREGAPDGRVDQGRAARGEPREQAELLEADDDHERAGDDREDAFPQVERAGGEKGGAEGAGDGPERGQRVDATGLVEQLPRQARGARAAGVGEREWEDAAHADAVHRAGEAAGEGDEQGNLCGGEHDENEDEHVAPRWRKSGRFRTTSRKYSIDRESVGA